MHLFSAVDFMCFFFLSALRKSQKEAGILVNKYARGKQADIHSQVNSNKSLKLVSDLTGLWRSHFRHMEDMFANESSQLVSVDFLALLDNVSHCGKFGSFPWFVRRIPDSYCWNHDLLCLSLKSFILCLPEFWFFGWGYSARVSNQCPWWLILITLLLSWTVNFDLNPKFSLQQAGYVTLKDLRDSCKMDLEMVTGMPSDTL